jgi:hypothetical protein
MREVWLFHGAAFSSSLDLNKSSEQITNYSVTTTLSSPFADRKFKDRNKDPE